MRTISRREILQYASALMAWSAAGACRAPIATSPKFAKDPFTLGIASGDPLPDGVVLWTRLAPEPLAGGGMTAGAVEVNWELAADEQMKQVVKRGIAQARPSWAMPCTSMFAASNRAVRTSIASTPARTPPPSAARARRPPPA